MDATEFFSRARILRRTGVYEYAIEMYICGLALEPENAHAHQELRETALQRTAARGRPLSLFDGMKVASVLRQKGADDKSKMLAIEHLLSYEPGNYTYMLALLKHAQDGGFTATAAWIEAIIRRSEGGA